MFKLLKFKLPKRMYLGFLLYALLPTNFIRVVEVGDKYRSLTVFVFITCKCNYIQTLYNYDMH